MTTNLQHKPQVRWWVVAGAIVASWALTCMGPKAAAGQTLILADSATLHRLAALHAEKRFETAACLVVWLKGDTLVIDSIMGLLREPPCPTKTNGLAGMSETDVGEAATHQIAWEVFTRFPKFLTVCLIYKTRPARYSDNPDGLFLIPVMRCAVHSKEE